MKYVRRYLYLVLLLVAVVLALALMSLNETVVPVYLGSWRVDISLGGALVLSLLLGVLIGAAVNAISRRRS